MTQELLNHPNNFCPHFFMKETGMCSPIPIVFLHLFVGIMTEECEVNWELLPQDTTITAKSDSPRQQQWHKAPN